MRTVARFILIASLVVWIGGIIFFSFILAPAAFTQFAPSQAGGLVRFSLTALHSIGIACGAMFLAATMLTSLNRATMLRALMGLMLLCTLISQFGLTPQMEKIRESVGGAIEALPPKDAGRAAFDRLHQISVGLESMVLLSGLGAIALIAAEENK